MRIYNADCLTKLDELIDNGVRVDLVLTDPPYLMDYKTNRRKDKNHDFCSSIENDDNPDIIKEVMPKLRKVMKKDAGIYMFCNDTHIDIFKQEFEKYFKMKNILVWMKNNHTAGDLKGSYAKRCEFIMYGYPKEGRRLLIGKRDTDVLEFDKVAGKKQVHQNQKPVDLLEYLLSKSTLADEIVLDPFMGSGSTGVACDNMNRNFIGIELDEGTFEIARERLDKGQSKLM